MQQDSIRVSLFSYFHKGRNFPYFHRKESSRAGISSSVKLLGGAVLGKINGNIWSDLFVNIEKFVWPSRRGGRCVQREWKGRIPFPPRKYQARNEINDWRICNGERRLITIGGFRFIERTKLHERNRNVRAN